MATDDDICQGRQENPGKSLCSTSRAAAFTHNTKKQLTKSSLCKARELLNEKSSAGYRELVSQDYSAQAPPCTVAQNGKGICGVSDSLEHDHRLPTTQIGPKYGQRIPQTTLQVQTDSFKCNSQKSMVAQNQALNRAREHEKKCITNFDEMNRGPSNLSFGEANMGRVGKDWSHVLPGGKVPEKLLNPAT